jgi:hypothetical protein
MQVKDPDAVDTIARVHTREDLDLAALKLCAMGERLGLIVTVVIKPQTKDLVSGPVADR